MLRKFFYSIAFIFFTLSSHATHWTYTGTIGEYPVFMSLDINDSKVLGVYCYKKQLINIYFTGTIKNGTISLETTNPNDYVISEDVFKAELFKLKWSQEKVTGTWTENGKLVLPVNLTKPDEKELNNARIKSNSFLRQQGYTDFDRLKIGYFKLKEIGSLHFENNLKIRTFEELNTKISLFRIDSGLNVSSQQTANHYLEYLHISHFLAYYDCAASTGAPGFTYSSGFYNITASNNLMSLAVFEISNCGYPHPDEYNFGINLNLVTQKEIKAVDYLKEGVNGLFQEKVIAYFKKEYPGYFDEATDEMDCEFYQENLWTANCKFIFTNNGIQLLHTFSHYRAPCYMPEWTIIPYSELKDLIKPEYWVLLNELKP